VLIAAADVQIAFKQRAAIAEGDVLVFSDTEPLRALATITTRRPQLVVLERIFAATPRGAALVNRIKSDPELARTEIRVLAHDSDYSRVLPRNPAGGPSASPGLVQAATSSVPAAAMLVALAEASIAIVDPPRLDTQGTRRATRFEMAENVEVLVDGNPAILVNLSTSGAQVVSATILKPNQRVRMVLTDASGIIRFNATIVWAAFEIPSTTGPRYRAGVDFVDADPAAVDRYCVRHRV
jgi:PilZ domain-containing protein